MGQRLGIASALLGDPSHLVLDEPVNGLDPEGVLWIRELLRQLAAEGRTILLSSHLMSEMAHDRRAPDRDRARPPDRGSHRRRADRPGVARPRPAAHAGCGRAAELLAREGAEIASPERDRLDVTGIDGEAIGELARRHGLALYELTPVRASLEEAFMELTRDEVEYRALAEVAA